MYNVNNRKCINELAKNSFKANKTKNIVAIIAIALTTLLFTAVFTIGSILIHSYEQSNFRQVGGMQHGSIKEVSYDEIEILKNHPIVEEYDIKKVLGVITEGDFSKNLAELSYADANYLKWSFVDLVEGNAPKENTMEMICDTSFLQTLGIEPIIGAEIPLTYRLDNGAKVSDTFVLSGYWKSQYIINKCFAFFPKSYVDKIVKENHTEERIDMSIMFRDSKNIEGNLNQILTDNGFQSEDTLAENYKRIGVNWAYSSVQILNNFDLGTVSFVLTLFSVFMLSGYLIIVNIFKISINNDIRFFGLLKTIGTTGRQIRKLVYKQAILLALIGIPLGLLSGYVTGIILTPAVLETLNIDIIELTVNPWVFVGGSIFSLITVFISCRKPVKIASKVSPIDALKYTEGTSVNKKQCKTHKSTPFSMARANIKRNKAKTTIVVVSLSLSILILQITFMFTNGFDMNKYLNKFALSDFLVGHTNYLNIVGNNFALSDQDIDVLTSIEGIEESGIVYGNDSGASIMQIKNNQDEPIQIYGMEDYALGKLNLIEGSLENGIISLGKKHKIGDKISIKYPKEVEYSIDEVYGYEYISDVTYADEVTFEVVGIAEINHNMGYRFYSFNDNMKMVDQFVLPTDLMDTNYFVPMNILIDVEDHKTFQVENIINNYTLNENTMLGFESRQKFAEEFYEFRSMFFIVGSLLSGVIGLIGILNFFNVILTSINTRKLEFATLQSIGMTGKQLKTMLVDEGITYITITILFTSILTVLTTPMVTNVMSGIFWFFTGNFTLVPLIIVTPIFLMIGIVTPLVLYKIFSKQSIVERLRRV
ncbi:hypothetical protein AN644_05210 [Candidatus Epulonipiscium fishelsonii]|nr:hypothetical protein AN644_05210 [Epulopiscium sp. SCG-C06WGA-EpuloA1]